MSETDVSVYLVDDHKIFVQGVAKLLASERGIKVLGYSYDAKSAMLACRLNLPDVVITDIRMDGMSGIELTHQLKEEHPEVKVIGLSMFDKPEIINDLIGVGAEGYLLKDLEREELVKAIHEVYEGNIYYSGTIARVLFKSLENKDFLTRREKEIIVLIAKEKTNAEMATQLFISEHTIESHRKNIFRKTKSKSIVGLINYAHDNKLI